FLSPPAAPAVQPEDRHLRPRPSVGERVVVEAPVEAEGYGFPPTLATRIRRGTIDDFALLGQRPVVRDRQGNRLRVGERAPGLGRAADNPAVAVGLVVADQRRGERA